MRNRCVIVPTAAVILLAGCTVGPEFRSPAISALPVPQQYVEPSTTDAPADIVAWWRVFADPTLTELVTQAAGGNLDIAQSAARLRQAGEALVQARGQRLPGASASASSGRNFNNLAGDSSAFSGSFDAQWALDLFGGLRRGEQASAADLAAAGYDLSSVRRTVAANVANSYVNYRVAVARLKIARDTLRTQDDNLEIAQFRTQAGLVSSIDVEQARTQRAQTAASLPLLDQSVSTARNQIAILTGQPPGSVDAVLLPERDIPAGPASITVGIPADTLRRRPDVRSAERALAAAAYRIGVTKARLYPALSLSGNIGTSAQSVRSLGDLLTGGVFASLAQTIFDGGVIRSQVRSQEAVTQGALAAYKSSILTALQDVENGLVALRTSQDRARELAVAIEAANNAAILARSQYRAGLTDFRTLLTAEQALLSARDGFASSQGAEATSVIQLYLALGGGWDPDAPAIDARQINVGPIDLARPGTDTGMVR